MAIDANGECLNVQVFKCLSVRVFECSSVLVTFKHLNT